MASISTLADAFLSLGLCIDPFVKGESYTNMANEVILIVAAVTAIN